MAQLKVFTLDNLKQYDGLIKGYVNEADAKSLKTVAIDGNTLKFYKVSEPVGETTPAYEITLPQTDISGLLEKLTGATEGNVVVANADGTVKDGGVALADLATTADVQELADGAVKDNADAIEAINNAETGILAQAKDYTDDLADGQVKTNKEAIEKLNGDADTEGSVAKAVADAKSEIDATIGEVEEGKTLVEMIADAQSEATYDDTDIKADIKDNADAIAAINNETTGILAQAKEYADSKDEAIEAAQKAGDDAQDAVDTLAGKVGEVAEGKTLAGLVSDNAQAIEDAAKDAKLTISTDATTEGYLKTYTFKQGETEIGKIDIAKDLVVTAGEIVVDPEGQPEGTYLKLTIANQDAPVYVNVKDLVDVYTAQQDAAQVQLTISDTNEVSAVLVAGGVGTTELADAAVTTDKIADGNVTRAKISAAFEAEIKALEDAIGEGGAVGDQIDAKIAELDADVASDDVEEGKGIKVRVVETDGKVESVTVTGNFDNAYDVKGSAKALEEGKIKDLEDKVGDGFVAITEAEINSLFTN